MYGDPNEKTTLNHRLLFSLLLLVVGGLGLAHAGYNVGVGRADITGPAAEVRPTQFTWHLPFYDVRRRSALLPDFSSQAISTIASDQTRTFWAYDCLQYAEVANNRRRCDLYPMLSVSDAICIRCYLYPMLALAAILKS
jgi:hypothetical protein